jgi:hypothetical protein
MERLPSVQENERSSPDRDDIACLRRDVRDIQGTLPLLYSLIAQNKKEIEENMSLGLDQITGAVEGVQKGLEDIQLELRNEILAREAGLGQIYENLAKAALQVEEITAFSKVREEITALQADISTSKTSKMSEIHTQMAILKDSVDESIAYQDTDLDSEGSVVQAAITQCCNDLQDVIRKAATQENRHEDLAQMQSKLIHDLMTQRTTQITQLQRKSSELHLNFQAFRQECESSFAQIREEHKDIRLDLMEFRQESSNNIQETRDLMRDQISRAKADTTAHVTDALSCFSELEDRCSAMEKKSNDSITFRTDSLDKRKERAERLAQAVEFSEGGLEELEGLINQYDMDLSDQLEREKSVQGDSGRRMAQGYANDCKRQTMEVERAMRTLEREPAEASSETTLGGRAMNVGVPDVRLDGPEGPGLLPQTLQEAKPANSFAQQPISYASAPSSSMTIATGSASLAHSASRSPQSMMRASDQYLAPSQFARSPSPTVMRTPSSGGSMSVQNQYVSPNLVTHSPYPTPRVSLSLQNMSQYIKENLGPSQYATNMQQPMKSSISPLYNAACK